MIHNLAKRAHDRNWALDPVVRSLLDTDWYKLAVLLQLFDVAASG